MIFKILREYAKINIQIIIDYAMIIGIVMIMNYVVKLLLIQIIML